MPTPKLTPGPIPYDYSVVIAGWHWPPDGDGVVPTARQSILRHVPLPPVVCVHVARACWKPVRRSRSTLSTRFGLVDAHPFRGSCEGVHDIVRT